MDERLSAWFKLQDWVRASDEPIVSLGAPGEWDEHHIFAPGVIYEDNRYLMWYSGGRGDCVNRIMSIGLAESVDGISFKKHPGSPVIIGSDKQSYVTPAVLRQPDGSVRRVGSPIAGRMDFYACGSVP